MTAVTSMAMTPPPRLFWRRAVAFFVDTVVFYSILMLLALPLQAVTGWNLGFYIGQSTTCEATTDSPLIREVETEWPLADGETRINQICINASIGMQQRFFISTVTKISDGTTSNRSVSIGIDQDGKAIPLDISATSTASNILLQLLFLALFVLASAKITAMGRRTPGKALLFLRITNAAGTMPSLKQCLAREFWKFLPSCLLGIAVTVHAAQNLPGLSTLASGEFADVIRAARDMQVPDFSTLLTVDVVASLLGALWWFGPFIVWRGQTIYDRLAGCIVVRSNEGVTW
ncbi:RDD family protein [Rhizobium sp. PL01]|uniref:RDD family protein n=1 Tax=Rhizobium sp. PL01 TaxID=3085631 RepID=UPI0029814FD2|nr:RDD family protein [Rhizobium sp. PL01]MDW5313381.1 RDD family protein [Rhizobium sp. PL01]